MPFMLKIQWDIKAGREADFRTNQAALCKVMLEHPGVICYHADYPSERVSQWTEIYATDEAFAAHLANEKGNGPLAAVIDACDKISCQCWGTQTLGPKRCSPILGRRTTRLPQTLLYLIPGPIGTRRSSEVPIAIYLGECRTSRLLHGQSASASYRLSLPVGVAVIATVRL